MLESLLGVLLCHVTLPDEPNLAQYLLGFAYSSMEDSQLCATRTPLSVVVEMLLAEGVRSFVSDGVTCVALGPPCASDCLPRSRRRSLVSLKRTHHNTNR